MLLEEQRDRVCVVLVRARNPQNIGAVARAMHDFGFGRMRVVTDYPAPFEGARSAVDASAVLSRAQVFGSVGEAVADCTLVVGTTAVGERLLEHPVYLLPEAAERIGAAVEASEGRVAILFGSEKTGLSNEEMSHCHWLATIPMQVHAEVRHPSMNLGQAAAVCLWELVRGMETRRFREAERPVSAAGSERLMRLLREVLEEAGYLRHHPANSGEEHLRRLIVRMGNRAGDEAVWMGMLRQVLWGLRQRGAGASE